MIKGNWASNADNEDGVGYCDAAQCDIDQMFYCPLNYYCDCKECEYYIPYEGEEEE